jgi:hypothetical protein
MNGKGSKPRPMSIDRDEWAERWERIRWGSEHPDWPEPEPDEPEPIAPDRETP